MNLVLAPLFATVNVSAQKGFLWRMLRLKNVLTITTAILTVLNIIPMILFNLLHANHIKFMLCFYGYFTALISLLITIVYISITRGLSHILKKHCQNSKVQAQNLNGIRVKLNLITVAFAVCNGVQAIAYFIGSYMPLWSTQNFIVLHSVHVSAELCSFCTAILYQLITVCTNRSNRIMRQQQQQQQQHA